MRVLCSVVLIALWHLPIILFSQSAINGTIHDAAEKPIPFCNVFLQRDGRLTKLTQTDEEGRYELTPLDSGTYHFSVTSIGYKRHSQELRLGNLPVTMNIILLPDTVVLDQVIVHDQGPILLKGDTVVYDATFFKSGEEIVLADLLKKLPGISVDESGKVKFKGKEVVKVKIEDDDLFENNYQILTKNLSADLVEQVEVLQNYSDNRLFKNIEDSEEVALNLTLKKDRKDQLFGDGRIESNLEQYDGRVNLMSLAKKSKIYFLSTGNNIGSDPGGEAEGLMQSSGRLPGWDTGAEFLVQSAKPLIPEFKKDRYYFNDVLLGSINTVFRPRKNLKVSLHGMGYRDQTEFAQASKSEYYTQADTTDFDELSLTTNQDRLGYVQAMVEYDASEIMNVRYRGRLDAFQGSTPQQNSLNLNSVTKELTSTTEKQDHLLTVSRKISDQSVLSLDLRLISDRKPQHLLVDGNLLTDYFLPISTSDTLDQSNVFESTLWAGQLSWLKRSRIGKLGVKVGYEHFNQRVETNLTSSLSQLSTNNLINRQGKAFVEGYYALSFGNLVITPGVVLQQVATELSDRSASGFTFVNPKVGLRWRFSEKSRLSAVYTLGQTTSTTNQLLPNPILVDYNKVALSDDGFRSFQTRSLLVTYEYGGLISGFNLFANLYHHESPAGYLSNTDLSPNYLVTTMNMFADRKMSSVSLTADQFLKAIKTNLKLAWRGSRAEFVTATEGISVPTESFTHSLDGSLRTGLAGPFNVHGGVSIQASSTASELIDASNYNVLLFLDGYLNAFDRRLNLTAHWERYELASISGQPVFFFVDFNARYTFKKRNGISLLLKGRNLLDETVFAQRYVSSQSVSTSTNRLIPRYLLAGVEFRF